MSGIRPPVFDLAGRVALLTGASSGIGARWARLLAAAGASVVLCARRAEPLEAIVADIAESGGKAVAVATDVADEQAIIAAYDAAERVFGTVDTVIADAGISHVARAETQPVEVFDQMVAINLRGVFLTARRRAPPDRLRQQRARTRAHRHHLFDSRFRCRHRAGRVQRSDGGTPETIVSDLFPAMEHAFTPLARPADIFPYDPV